MRLTVLTLFITLPAVAYGAVCPQQNLLEFKGECSLLGESCADRACCSPWKCIYDPILHTMVRLVTPFALIHVGVLSLL